MSGADYIWVLQNCNSIIGAFDRRYKVVGWLRVNERPQLFAITRVRVMTQESVDVTADF